MSRKILVIDDNKMLSKLLAKKITNSLDFEVDVAFSFEETRALVENNDYFLSFIDLCLPDAPDGEVVDYMVGKNCPSIVLTASNDIATKEKFMDKDILGYIFKESDSCIDEIIQSITNLSHYEKTKVILAMSKLPERNVIKKYLSQRLFNVLAAAHGEEALNYLNDNSDVKLIICDAKMPVVDSLELLREVRTKYTKSELGVIVLGEKDDILEANLLKEDVNEYLIKPINKEVFNHRLDRCLMDMNNLAFLHSYSDVDYVSGVKNSSALINDIENYLSEGKQEDIAFMFLDIDNLKSLNQDYGYAIGDDVIRICAQEIKNEIKGKDIVGRYSPEKFCVLLKNTSNEVAIKIFSQIRVNIKKTAVIVNLDELFFTASLGVVFAKSNASLQDLVKKAEEALSTAKSNGGDRVEVCP